MEAQEGEAQADRKRRKTHKSEKEKEPKHWVGGGGDKRTKEAIRRMVGVRWIYGVHTVSLSQVVRTPIYLQGEIEREVGQRREKNKNMGGGGERDTNGKTERHRDRKTDKPTRKTTYMHERLQKNHSTMEDIKIEG